MPSNPRARIKEIRKRLDILRRAMLAASADDIENTLPALAEAAESLIALTQELAAAKTKEPLLNDVRILRADLARLADLSNRGLEFCRRWSNTLQNATGYLPTGEAAPLPSSTISIRG